MTTNSQPNMAVEINLPKRYYGKYRGTVLNNIDRLRYRQQVRIRLFSQHFVHVRIDRYDVVAMLFEICGDGMRWSFRAG